MNKVYITIGIIILIIVLFGLLKLILNDKQEKYLVDVSKKAIKKLEPIILNFILEQVGDDIEGPKKMEVVVNEVIELLPDEIEKFVPKDYVKEFCEFVYQKFHDKVKELEEQK